LTDTSLYIYICVKHFGMANIKFVATCIAADFKIRVSRRRRSIRQTLLASRWHDKDNVLRNALRVAVFVVCVFYDDSITRDPCCALCIVTEPHKELYRRDDTAESCFIPSDVDMNLKN